MTTPPSTWTYGEEGQQYPVASNEVWECGDHLFACSDLMTSDLFPHLVEDAAPTLIYTDPPWGQALLNGFRTKAQLPKATYDWTILYRKIASIAHGHRPSPLPLWIEGSLKDRQKIETAIGQPLSQAAGFAEITYYHRSANPAGLWYAGPPPADRDVDLPDLLDALIGQDDDDTPGIVMRAYGEYGTVLDPCAGRGQTSREAERVGWHSVNNELNPHRVSAALARMAHLIGPAARPRRLG